MEIAIEDISEFVATQRGNVGTTALVTPREDLYPIADISVAAKLGLARH